MPKPGDVIITEPEPFCPECGAKMKLKLPRYGKKYYEPFWGCSQYPDCRGIRHINPWDGKPEEDSGLYVSWEARR
jgi:ssDNA-binding Zn-finger/Zn-ribbon topoisomerase 1